MPLHSLPRLALLTGFCTLLAACTPPTPWHAATLTAESQTNAACITQLHTSINEILAAETTGITINEADLQTFIEAGALDQNLNLYGGRQIRHWIFATFDDLETCTVYNHATTRIDLMTRAETTEHRPVRSGSTKNQNARRPLPGCTCSRS